MIHQYQDLQIAIVIKVIERNLDDFLDFSQCVLQHDQTNAAR